ncbi:MAG: START-like domain-containing protein [Chitinophagaceae bacterium]
MAKKQLYTLEYPIKCSPSILYGFLSTASGLQEWFADSVTERDGVFSFSWNGSEPDKAKILEHQEDKLVRFQWLHEAKEEYFEFDIETAEISNQTILIIKAFAEKNDIKDESLVWDHQVKDLFRRLGS